LHVGVGAEQMKKSLEDNNTGGVRVNRGVRESINIENKKSKQMVKNVG